MDEACVGMNDIIIYTQVRGGWTTLVQFITKEVKRMENRHIELLNLVTLKQGIYYKTKAYVVEREVDIMRNMMVRMMEDINLYKGKLGIEIVEEIAKAKKVEAEKKKEAEERKRKTEDKNEADQKAKAQKKEEKRRRNAEELAAAEEEKQRKGRNKPELRWNS